MHSLYYVQATANAGQMGISTRKLCKWIGHRSTHRWGQMIFCDTPGDVLKHQQRARAIGLRTIAGGGWTRAEHLAELKRMYPGSNISALRKLGFTI